MYESAETPDHTKPTKMKLALRSSRSLRMRKIAAILKGILKREPQ
jgi:hypothetical protein